MAKLKFLKVITFVIVSLVFITVLYFGHLPQAFASTINGGGNAIPIVKPPLEDGYFIAMAAFFVGIVYEIIRIVILLKKIKTLENKRQVKLSSFIPYGLATLLSQTASKTILVIEIIVFCVLFLVLTRIKRKLQKLI